MANNMDDKGNTISRREMLRLSALGAASLAASASANGALASALPIPLDWRRTGKNMSYRLEGRLLEVCSCNVLCPCWIGEDPDGGTCEAITAWHIDRGTINGVDVSGLTIASFAHIPGNILKGNFRVAFYVPDHASEDQTKALEDVWTGKLGGPVADLAGLFGEVVGLERVPITFTVEGGEGTIKIGTVAEATMAPYKGATGKTTALSETVFSTIPGSPAYVAKASNYRRDATKYGFKPINLQGHNAIQGNFLFEY